MIHSQEVLLQVKPLASPLAIANMQSARMVLDLRRVVVLQTRYRLRCRLIIILEQHDCESYFRILLLHGLR